jgi:DNA polymerase III epsilon subunit-like protein
MQVVMPDQALKIPDTYLVIDIETTHPEIGLGQIWQLGLYPVLDGVPVYKDGMAINLDLSENILTQASFEIKRRMVDAGKLDKEALRTDSIPSGYEKFAAEFVDEVKSSGVSPKKALESFADIIKQYSNYCTVGHNFVSFDVPYLEHAFLAYGVDYKFNEDKMLDTGLIIKATRLYMRKLARETNRAFFARVRSRRAKGVYFAIERFCIPYWQLNTRYGIEVSKAHNAGYDCYITSLILNELLKEADSGVHVNTVLEGERTRGVSLMAH